MKLSPFLDFFFFTKGPVIYPLKLILKRITLHKRHLLHGIIIGAVISLVVTVLAWLGHFKTYERPLTDFLQSVTHKKAKDVVLLFITDKEYKEGFAATSPLSRKRLADMIDILVKLKAKVIALDIDLSDPTPSDRFLLDATNRSRAAGIPIVVVANFKNLDEKSLPPQDTLGHPPYSGNQFSFTPEGFILFNDASPGIQWAGKVFYGGVVFSEDRDGIFRQAEALYLIKKTGEKRNAPYDTVPSFPVAVAAAYQGMSLEATKEALSHFRTGNITLRDERKGHQPDIDIHLSNTGRITANFVGNYSFFDRETNLTRLLEDYGPGKPAAQTIFKDKIVIVGGTYDKKDFYITPVGLMSGMETLANLTQNIISGNLITHTSFWKAFFIEWFLGMIVSILFIFSRPLWATMLCFVTVLPVVVLASLLAFSNSYHWFDFIPTIAGIMLHEWVHKGKDHVQAIKEQGQPRPGELS